MGGIKYEDEIRQLNIIDDILFRKMAEDKIFCEEMLRVIKVFSQTNEYSDKFPVASEKKRFFRTQNKEVENMSMVLQELIEKERADAAKVAVLEGRKEGIKENSFIVAKNMKENGLSFDMIIKCTGLSKEDLNSL